MLFCTYGTTSVLSSNMFYSSHSVSYQITCGLQMRESQALLFQQVDERFQALNRKIDVVLSNAEEDRTFRETLISLPPEIAPPLLSRMRSVRNAPPVIHFSSLNTSLFGRPCIDEGVGRGSLLGTTYLTSNSASAKSYLAAS